MRRPQNSFLRKDDLIYLSQANPSDGLEGGVQAAAGDNRIALQAAKMFQEIQESEAKLRHSINEQQNKVLLLDASNKLNAINKQAYIDYHYDPEEFKNQTTQQSLDVLSNLSLPLREAARRDFQDQQDKFYYQIMANKRDYLNKQTFEQAQVAIKNSAEICSNIVERMFDPIEKISADAQEEFATEFAKGMAFLETQDSWGRTFTPTTKRDIQQSFMAPIFQRFSQFKMNAIEKPEDKVAFLKEVLNGTAEITARDPVSKETISVPISGLDYSKRQIIGRVLDKQIKNSLKQQKDEKLIGYAQQWLSGNKSVFAPPEVHEKAMNLMYPMYRKELGLENIITADQATRDKITNSLCSFIEKSEVLVDGMKEDIEGLQNSGVPELFEMGANIISFIRANAEKLPNVVRNLSQKNFTESVTMARLSSFNIPAEQSYSTIDNEFWKMTPEDRERRGKQFASFLHDNETFTPATILKGDEKEIAQTNELTSYIEDYIFLAQKSFMEGGSIEDSKKFADTFILNKWHKVKENGKTYMRAYPPEMFYGVPGIYTEEDIQQDIQNYAKGLGIKDYQNVIAVADTQTYRELSIKNPEPTYALWVVRDGIPQQIRDKELNVQARIGGDDFRPQQVNEIRKEFNALDEQEKAIDLAIDATFREANQAVLEQQKKAKENPSLNNLLLSSYAIKKPFAEKRKALNKQKDDIERQKKSLVDKRSKQKTEERFNKAGETVSKYRDRITLGPQGMRLPLY